MLNHFSGCFFPSLLFVNNLFFRRQCTLTTEQHVSVTNGWWILDLYALCVYQVSNIDTVTVAHF